MGHRHRGTSPARARTEKGRKFGGTITQLTMVPVDDGTGSAPIDRSVVERMRSRFAGQRMFELAEIVENERLHLPVDVSDEYYPREATARFEIRWYRNDDFSIHYQEQRQNGEWKCRWDRHPNNHNSRDHFHPPPDASPTDAKDAQWPVDHRNMCRLVLDRVESRIETLWERE